MKKSTLVITLITILMISCDHADDPIVTESKFVATWEAQRIEKIYEEGILNENEMIYSSSPKDISIDELESDELMFVFSVDSLFISNKQEKKQYKWNYTENILSCSYEFDNGLEYIEFQVEEISNTSLHISYYEYKVFYNKINDKQCYTELKENIYFKSVELPQSPSNFDGHLFDRDYAFIEQLKLMHRIDKQL